MLYCRSLWTCISYYKCMANTDSNLSGQCKIQQVDLEVDIIKKIHLKIFEWQSADQGCLLG